MKILEMDYEYYSYPQGISSVEDFIEYINHHYGSFIPMTRFNTENCGFPDLIEEETMQVFINVSQVNCVREVEATLLPRAEYDARLTQIVKRKCIDCVNYTEDSEGDNLKGHRGKITLDGQCWGYVKKEN